MTRDADFKKLVRARMVESDESYLQARTAMMQAPPPADVQALLGPLRHSVRQFFDGDRLRSIPTKRTTRMTVLLVLVPVFRAGRTLTEAQVTQVLGAVHEDHAYLRRELVNAGYLTREASQYALAAAPPVRDPRWASEFPAQEADVFAALWRDAPVS